MDAETASFSSRREARLWASTAVVVAAIYSTLGVAGAIADELRERNLLRVALSVAVVAIVAPVGLRWLRTRPTWRDIAAALSVIFVFWMVWVRAGSVEERTHLVEYGVVAALIHMALLERVSNGRVVPRPAAVALALTTLLGAVDECIQAVLPSRVFDVRDIFFNFVAGFMVIAARLALEPQERPGWRVWFLWLWATAFGWGTGVYWGWFTNDEPKTLEAVPVDLRAGYLGLVTGAALVAGLQWPVLRRHVTSSARWLLATSAAVVVVGAVILALRGIDREWAWIAGVSMFGTVVGTFQWAVLRGQIPRAGWWVLASTAGWAAGMPFGDINGPPGLGAIFGVVTASALVLLLRQDREPETQPK